MIDLNDDELANMAGCSHEHTQLERELVAELRKAREIEKLVRRVLINPGNNLYVMKSRLAAALTGQRS